MNAALPVPVKVVAVAALAAGTALLLRYGLVEPDEMGRLCTSAAAPAWCLARQALVLGFVFNVYGWASVAAALAALLARRAWPAWLALGAGLFGCVLYRFDPAAAGVLLAALVLGRLGAHAQGGEGEQHA